MDTGINNPLNTYPPPPPYSPSGAYQVPPGNMPQPAAYQGAPGHTPQAGVYQVPPGHTPQPGAYQGAPGQATVPGPYQKPQGQLPGESSSRLAHEDSEDIPINDLQQIPGYNEATFVSTPTAPPRDSGPQYEPPTDRNQLLNVPNLTDEQAREAVMNFASEKCCYGTRAARDMIINEITYKSAFHYTLETFTEKRETARAFKPYKGTPLSVGYAPLPWEIVAHPKTPFKNDHVVIEIPNTEEVRPCHVCVGLGHKRCHRCLGAGNTCCSSCGGSGHRFRNHDGNHHHDQCHGCHGSGRERCFHCMGHGHVTCKTCNGKSQLRFYIQLTVTWTNHIEDHISDTHDFPKELIREVSGQVALEERYPRVYPVTQFPDNSVNLASQTIVARHDSAFPFERILEQRQRIRIVPIAEVLYKWKDTNGRFHVYGFETKVYCPDYPQPCCWGCNVL